MLAHKLGVSSQKKIFARKTTVIKLNSHVARDFLDSYHIQGFSSGSTYIGLEDDQGNLVAVSAWRKNKNLLYLDRYATNCTVVGGMGKLLSSGKSFAVENNCQKIITFADHHVSDGKLYESLGFSKEKELNPDYKYFAKGQRKHKFGYRLKRFRTDPNLMYLPGKTE